MKDNRHENNNRHYKNKAKTSRKELVPVIIKNNRHKNNNRQNRLKRLENNSRHNNKGLKSSRKAFIVQ